MEDELHLVDRLAGISGVYSPEWVYKGKGLIFFWRGRLNLIKGLKDFPREIFLEKSLAPLYESPLGWRMSVSRDGGRLAYLASDKKIWIYDLTKGKGFKATGGPGVHTSPAWSPDDTKICFVMNMEGDEELYVCDLKEKSLEAILSDERYSFTAPMWSMDGSKIAFVAYPREDYPWHESSIGVIETNSKKVQMLTELDGSSDIKVRWIPGRDSIAFLSDRDGFYNIYTLDLNGVETKLTELKHDVEEYDFSPKGNLVALTVNVDCDKKLVILDLNTGGKRVLMDGVNSQLKWSPDGRFLAFIHQSPSHPPSLYVYDSIRDTVECIVDTRPIGAPFHKIVKPEVVYLKVHERKVNLLLYRPPPSFQGKLPVIIFLHGGPNMQYLRSWKPSLQKLVYRGIVVVELNYTGSSGFGRGFHYALHGRWCRILVEDLGACLNYLKSLGYVDAQRIGVYGASAGGYGVLVALTHMPRDFCMGVEIAGIVDMESYTREADRFARKLIRAEMGEDRELWRKCSPIHYLDKLNAPLLMIHGDADTVVPVSQAKMLIRRLRQLGKRFVYKIYRGEWHIISKPENRLDMQARIQSFIDKYLLHHKDS